ncbi:outer dense fiber protein 2 [Gouania willdenowi]|uniref:Outer dense fiber protein 2 n=1 Tax=Gouania willdenowi TaxID=441366 RepID=A0A8C5GBL0_GOUWI|nr:outer dense fiber protein 2 [Gouania willdenowi]
MKTSPSPVHVHINDATPVHVHVKSGKRSPQGKSIRPSAKVKTRVPWIPPGKNSTREQSLKWEGPTHRLQICPPRAPASEPEFSQPELRLADLVSEDEESLNGRISQYERKVDGLQTEVGALKIEVEQRKQQLLDIRSEQMSVSRQVMVEQEEKLAHVTKELQQSEQENLHLRQSMEKMMEQADSRRNDDALLRKLKQVEVDGEEAAKQVSTLRDFLSKMMTVSVSQPEVLACHKELLLQKLETFEKTNRALRQLLREKGDSQMESGQEREDIRRRLADTEAENVRLQVKLQEKDREATQLGELLEAEKDKAMTSSNKSVSLETIRAHLQGQLRSREAENSRLSVQIKNLERAAAQHKAEMEILRQQLSSDREALKRATRTQKRRAERSEDAAALLSVRLQETEKQAAEAVTAAETWESRHAQTAQEKKKLEAELLLLTRRVEELKERLHSTEERSRAEREELLDELHKVTSESSTAKMKNHSLQAAVSAAEEKLSVSQAELQQIKANVTQYESLLDRYKTQFLKTRAEADESCAWLGEAERGAATVRRQRQQEVDQARQQLQLLQELPEALRRSQIQLQEAQEKERCQERLSADMRSSLTELTRKVESQSSHMELSRQKNKLLMEENLQLKQQVETLERKLQESCAQSNELLALITKREEMIRSHELRLEEKSTECSVLSRKLQEAQSDAHQQITESRERATARERSTMDKILDLETKLSQVTSEVNQLRRSKKEAERRYQSRLQDVKDQLEQSDSTNRSLQNYVQFLKTSYADVFTDVALSTALRAPSPL